MIFPLCQLPLNVIRTAYGLWAQEALETEKRKLWLEGSSGENKEKRTNGTLWSRQQQVQGHRLQTEGTQLQGHPTLHVEFEVTHHHHYNVEKGITDHIICISAYNFVSLLKC